MNWYKKAQEDPNIKRIEELSKTIDRAYETNQLQNIEIMEEELENLIEKITSKNEALLTEGYDIEGEGKDTREEASLEEILANLYYQYVNFNPNQGPFLSKEDVLENMRSNIMMFGGNPSVSNKDLLEAAKDSYNRKINLKKKYELV